VSPGALLAKWSGVWDSACVLRSQTADGWEELFWSVFERSTNAIALLDERRVYLDANAALCELLGASREEIVGARADRFVAPEEVAALDHDSGSG
jgi:PAS domain-containing protein